MDQDPVDALSLMARILNSSLAAPIDEISTVLQENQLTE